MYIYIKIPALCLVFFSLLDGSMFFQVKQLKDSIAQMQVPPAPLDLVETKNTEGIVHNQGLKTQMIHFTAVYIYIYYMYIYLLFVKKYMICIYDWIPAFHAMFQI